MIFDGNWFRHDRVAIEDGVGARRHGDLAELAAGRAVELHVPPRLRRIELRWRDGAERHLELPDQPELRHLLHPGTDATLGGAVPTYRDQHMTTDPGRDSGSGALDRGHTACAAERRGGGEAEIADAEIGDELLGNDSTPVGDHSVDVGGTEPRVLDRPERRFELQR